MSAFRRKPIGVGLTAFSRLRHKDIYFSNHTQIFVKGVSFLVFRGVARRYFLGGCCGFDGGKCYFCRLKYVQRQKSPRYANSKP